jgi:hypothetical protein
MPMSTGWLRLFAIFTRNWIEPSPQPQLNAGKVIAMTAASELDPLFVHASPRSGSTYFFNVLRRNEHLMCFNEAINDAIGYWGKHSTAKLSKRRKWDTNHLFLDRDDFVEVVEGWDAVRDLYPPSPRFQDYVPANGILSSSLRAYLAGLIDFARTQQKRPALCETHSRGRAGALRDAFGGFHIAQYRDPLNQFGSFYRPLSEAGETYFLVFPLMELGISGHHPLYSLVPEAWRVPILPWPADDPAQRWASTIEYLSMVTSPRPDTLERLFRWHLFSWVLSNLAAISHSDFILDIDRAHDDSEYRNSVIDALSSEIGAAPDFSDLKKFSRYYEFESFDVAAVCSQVESTIKQALSDRRLDEAVRTLRTEPPTVPAAAAVELLIKKICTSLAAMEASVDRRRVTVEDWKIIAEKNHRIWFKPGFRAIAQTVYPLAEPIVRAARRAGIWN